MWKGVSVDGWEYMRVEAFLERQVTGGIQKVLASNGDRLGELSSQPALQELGAQGQRPRNEGRRHLVADHQDRRPRYVFAANGRYQTIAGYQTFQRTDASMLRTTTHGFAGDGSDTVEGSKLTMTPDGKGKRV